MRKILAVVLAVMFMASVCFASDTISKRVYSIKYENTHGSNAQTSIVPTTSIRPKVDKLIGYSIMPRNGAGAECFIGIFDGTDVLLTGECLAEAESDNLKGRNELWPYGKWIEDGVVVQQGANTIVQIFFVRE